MPDLENRILLVDDDAAIVRAYRKALTAEGWTVESAADGREAVDRLRDRSFDVIISDVSMPRMNGLEFLRAVREHDLDVPVILMAGAPDLDSSLRAIEYGAFRYLAKPIDMRLLEQTVHHAAQLHSLARLKRDALEYAGVERRRLGDRAGLEARFALAMKTLWMAYQPIVSLKAHAVYGYEALLRSYEPSLREPPDLLDAAHRLGRVPQLGRAVRSRVALDAAHLPVGARLLVNLDAIELNDGELYAAESPLGNTGSPVVLELTERESLDGVHDVSARVARLRAMGFMIAIDDLGSGYAGLATISQLEPDIAKLDMSLVRNIHAEPRKRSIVRSMIELCGELGTVVVAEGVETPEERDTLAELGCDLLQGFLFAHPQKGYPAVQW
jgi:EAL domain-containing protein (putative c-di-GMP-specific phosphodiesterase class I)/CheY-like chemotaxis protein